MQNRKLIITALMTLFSSGSFADDIQATGENAGGLPAPIQEHISRLMEDDVAFNQAEHQLSQQLTLAKLRLEMAKIKSEAAELTQGPILNMNNESADKDIQPTPLPAAAEPRVMMLSQIAGITQAAVAVGSKTVFVRIGEIFTANGKRYAVHQGSNAQQSFVREVSR
ncbi:hypothetical protein [Rahnella variigena]|jgi:hypothetical protein|uniref:Type IV pilus biogenesis protein PilP n=1 Tax=Rahnella variigena TaxID=574964 RepID=A0ABX9PS91_9GAMM|nr:hypothetical protein [Rahnella variigena]RJT53775.1 hypothetical protein D6D38_09935 [Rahnella variigena]RKF67913.1 hypothetical protein CKQ54_05765 [Rahnella variigena]